MSIWQRTKQGGSAASFIIIGIILVTGLIGITYYVVQRGTQVRKSQETNIAKKDASTTKNEATTTANTNVVVDDGAATKTATNTAVSVDNSDALPKTGLSISVSELFGVFMLVIVSVEYILSKKAYRQTRASLYL